MYQLADGSHTIMYSVCVSVLLHARWAFALACHKVRITFVDPCQLVIAGDFLRRSKCFFRQLDNRGFDVNKSRWPTVVFIIFPTERGVTIRREIVTMVFIYFLLFAYSLVIRFKHIIEQCSCHSKNQEPSLFYVIFPLNITIQLNRASANKTIRCFTKKITIIVNTLAQT
jgi:hypothetical protein